MLNNTKLVCEYCKLSDANLITICKCKAYHIHCFTKNSNVGTISVSCHKCKVDTVITHECSFSKTCYKYAVLCGTGLIYGLLVLGFIGSVYGWRMSNSNDDLAIGYKICNNTILVCSTQCSSICYSTLPTWLLYIVKLYSVGYWMILSYIWGAWTYPDIYQDYCLTEILSKTRYILASGIILNMICHIMGGIVFHNANAIVYGMGSWISLYTLYIGFTVIFSIIVCMYSIGWSIITCHKLCRARQDLIFNTTYISNKPLIVNPC